MPLLFVREEPKLSQGNWPCVMDRSIRPKWCRWSAPQYYDGRPRYFTIHILPDIYVYCICTTNGPISCSLFQIKIPPNCAILIGTLHDGRFTDSAPSLILYCYNLPNYFFSFILFCFLIKKKTNKNFDMKKTYCLRQKTPAAFAVIKKEPDDDLGGVTPLSRNDL